MSNTITDTARSGVVKFVPSDGGVEALKWLALVLMTVDHVNKYLFNDTLPFLFEAGRLAMPLFAVVLGLNLARAGSFNDGVHLRVMTRLMFWGVLATPPLLALGELWPLNVMFTLLLATLSVYGAERGGRVAIAAFLAAAVGGAAVEFWWPAIALTVASWWYFKRSNWARLAVLVGAGFAFWIGSALIAGEVSGVGTLFVWQSAWALAALPVVGAACLWRPRVPRIRRWFYAYYPLHLCALVLIRIPMRHSGYLFFT